jgi:hypothetical protein
VLTGSAPIAVVTLLSTPGYWLSTVVFGLGVKSMDNPEPFSPFSARLPAFQISGEQFSKTGAFANLASAAVLP